VDHCVYSISGTCLTKGNHYSCMPLDDTVTYLEHGTHEILFCTQFYVNQLLDMLNLLVLQLT
jgi:hypothetical protein